MSGKIFKLLIIAVVAAFIISSCDEDDGVPYTFTSEVDATGSIFADHQSTTILQFSTDNGVSFSTAPLLKTGQNYKVRVFDTESGEPITSPNFTFDWSGSDPAPSNLSTDLPEFTLGETNLVKVKVVNTHCAYDASSWTGDWFGLEDGACCGGTDELTVEADPDTPNRFIISNFWADGPDVKVYIDLTPSTNFFDQIVTMPEQETSEGGIAVGEGTYDQCAGTMSINTAYEIGGHTYEWVYEFYR